MEYLNVLQFIKQYEQDEDAQRVDELNELNEDAKKIYIIVTTIILI